jgi:hypothetical protein
VQKKAIDSGVEPGLTVPAAANVRGILPGVPGPIIRLTWRINLASRLDSRKLPVFLLCPELFQTNNIFPQNRNGRRHRRFACRYHASLPIILHLERDIGAWICQPREI